MVRPAGRFRQAEAAAAVQHKRDGVSDIYPMTGGDVERFGSLFGAQHRADHPAMFIEQVGAVAAARTRFPVPAVEARFGHADGRTLQLEFHLRGDAQATRVSDALSIEHHQVGQMAEFFPGGQHGRTFAKGQQSGDVRES